MAKDSSGAKNQPIFAETGAPQLGTDLTLVSEYAALVGNRKIGTTAQRTALTGSDVWPGLAFWDTDLNFEFIWDGSAWAGAPVYLDTADVSPLLTMASNWSLNNAQLVTCGAVCSFRANVSRTTSAISSETHGNIVNTLVLTLNTTKYRPAYGSISLATDNTGFNCAFSLNADGTCYITALPPGISVGIGENLSLSGTYLRQVA